MRLVYGGPMSRSLISALLLSASLSLLLGRVEARAECENPSRFGAWLQNFKEEAVGQGISERAISALEGVTYDPAVIKRDRSQSVFAQDFLTFSNRMIAPYRLKQGAALIAKYRPIFQQVERRYGVPAPVIVAFWALETDFGANMGDFSTLRSLATLAFDCRRPEKFRPQLVAALKILDEGDLEPDD